ncbi:hypothetical protein ZIOFF_041535 [Zingiber officinale]|uniref:TLC domain-containing protein n=1 Tax=Zingiber officinale TaxID=94328 RepID=A0A8J5GDU9_ZINOF|nr:hypothetical protein ZIOFF_041535 [Zingiber officinale]
MDLTVLRSGVGGPAPDNLVLILVFAFGSFLARLLLDRLVYKVRIFGSLLLLPAHLVGDLSSSLMLFFMCQCGFYTYSIVALYAWDIRRKDFSITMSHHIITSILIGFSYITRFFRIGTLILALHDTSDVFMESAKLFKYSGMEMAASLFFGLFAISWLLLRLIYFPFWIIKSSSYESFESLSWMNQFPTMLYYMFNTMLITLLIFHAYWGKLIFAMIMKQMSNRGQVGEDIRSDSEDEG